MRIGIAKTTRNGLCSDTCPLFSPSCPLMADDEVQPGPSCPGPGVYVLVPELEEKALRELAEAALETRRLFDLWAETSDEAEADRIDDALEVAGDREKAALARLRELKGGGK